MNKFTKNQCDVRIRWWEHSLMYLRPPQRFLHFSFFQYVKEKTLTYGLVYRAVQIECRIIQGWLLKVMIEKFSSFGLGPTLTTF